MPLISSIIEVEKLSSKQSIEEIGCYSKKNQKNQIQIQTRAGHSKKKIGIRELKKLLLSSSHSVELWE